MKSLFSWGKESISEIISNQEGSVARHGGHQGQTDRPLAPRILLLALLMGHRSYLLTCSQLGPPQLARAADRLLQVAQWLSSLRTLEWIPSGPMGIIA